MTPFYCWNVDAEVQCPAEVRQRKMLPLLVRPPFVSLPDSAIDMFATLLALVLFERREVE
jgi:hypothetical protein